MSDFPTLNGMGEKSYQSIGEFAAKFNPSPCSNRFGQNIIFPKFIFYTFSDNPFLSFSEGFYWLIHQSNIFFQHFVSFQMYAHGLTKEYALVFPQTNLLWKHDMFTQVHWPRFNCLSMKVRILKCIFYFIKYSTLMQPWISRWWTLQIFYFLHCCLISFIFIKMYADWKIIW